MKWVLLVFAIFAGLGWIYSFVEISSATTVFQEIVVGLGKMRCAIAFVMFFTGFAICDAIDDVYDRLNCLLKQNETLTRTNGTLDRISETLNEIRKQNARSAAPPSLPVAPQARPQESECVACPVCKKTIPLSTLTPGKNFCHSCGETFEMVEKE